MFLFSRISGNRYQPRDDRYYSRVERVWLVASSRCDSTDCTLQSGVATNCLAGLTNGFLYFNRRPNDRFQKSTIVSGCSMNNKFQFYLIGSYDRPQYFDSVISHDPLLTNTHTQSRKTNRTRSTRNNPEYTLSESNSNFEKSVSSSTYRSRLMAISFGNFYLFVYCFNVIEKKPRCETHGVANFAKIEALGGHCFTDSFSGSKIRRWSRATAFNRAAV